MGQKGVLYLQSGLTVISSLLRLSLSFLNLLSFACFYLFEYGLLVLLLFS